jgi:hypothetical protein
MIERLSVFDLHTFKRGGVVTETVGGDEDARIERAAPARL